MTAPTMRTVTITSPAKINLGLEVIGKRKDGYHEIRTVMAMVDLFDEITITLNPDSPATRISGFDRVDLENNLIAKAVQLFEQASGFRYGYDIDVVKRIPYPAGLAGASSNAASTLMALNATHGAPIPADNLVRLAQQIGSDVPFFMGATVALARGTGVELEPLPGIDGWVLIVVPAIDIQEKTKTLYSMLTENDYSRENHVLEVVEAISNDQLPSPKSLRNAFLRPLAEIAPQVPQTMDLMCQHGCPFVALTGAGPGMYSIFDSEEVAMNVLTELQEHIGPADFIDVAPFALATNSAELVTDVPEPDSTAEMAAHTDEVDPTAN